MPTSHGAAVSNGAAELDEADSHADARGDGVPARNRRMPVVPVAPERFVVWLLFAGAFLADMMVTLAGQSDAWWLGLWKATNERNPAVEHLFQRGPGLVALYSVLCVVVAYLLARNLPVLIAAIIALWLSAGHAIAARNWMFVYSGPDVATWVLIVTAVLAVAAGIAVLGPVRLGVAMVWVSTAAFLVLGFGVAIVGATAFDRSSINEPDVVASKLVRTGLYAEADRIATAALDDPRSTASTRHNAHMAVARVAAVRCDRDRLKRHLAAAIEIAQSQSDRERLLFAYSNEEAARLLLSVGEAEGARQRFSIAAEAFEAFGNTPGIANAAEWHARAVESRRLALALGPEDTTGAAN